MSNEFDFEGVVKHLDITPVVEAPDGISQFRINKTPSVIEPVRDIRKIHYQLKIPAGVTNTLDSFKHSYIALQYNYSASSDFFINASSVVNLFGISSALCIRYRIGNTAYRYFLRSNKIPPIIADATMFFAERYTNQLIKKNFVIEFWAYPFLFRGGNLCGLLNDFLITTSKLKIPATVDETQAFLNDGEQVTNNLYTALPEILPTNETVGAWLDNP